MARCAGRSTGRAAAGSLAAVLLLGSLLVCAPSADAAAPILQWTTHQATAPADHSTSAEMMPDAVSCNGPTACLAVGQYHSGPGNVPAGFLEPLRSDADPSRFLLPSDANTVNPSSALNAVSCATAEFCAVVGSYNAGGSTSAFFPVGLLGTGSPAGAWTAVRAPAPANIAPKSPIEFVRAVSCPVPQQCVAVGNYLDAMARYRGLVETLAGGSWSGSELPVPQNASAAAIVVSAVGCPSSSYCVAVGSFVDDTGVTRGLIETFAGGVWTPSETPRSVEQLSAVSCPEAGFCWAVGSNQASGGANQAIVDRLADGNWLASVAPLPADASGTVPSSLLASISCPETWSCVAGGSYVDMNLSTDAFTDELSSQSWVPEKVPDPPNGVLSRHGSVSGVSCPIPSSCDAVGNWQTLNLGSRGLIARGWTGD